MNDLPKCHLDLSKIFGLDIESPWPLELESAEYKQNLPPTMHGSQHADPRGYVLTNAGTTPRRQDSLSSRL